MINNYREKIIQVQCTKGKSGKWRTGVRVDITSVAIRQFAFYNKEKPLFHLMLLYDTFEYGDSTRVINSTYRFDYHINF